MGHLPYLGPACTFVAFSSRRIPRHPLSLILIPGELERLREALTLLSTSLTRDWDKRGLPVDGHSAGDATQYCFPPLRPPRTP